MVTDQKMPIYEVCQCEDSERWRVSINGICDYSLGEFNSRMDAETKLCQLILQQKILAIDSSAKFKIPLLKQSREYTGSILSVIGSSENFSCGVAQSMGCGYYALHTGEVFASIMPDCDDITVKYRDGKIKIEFPKVKERNEIGR
jgi:hypothetical protein